jgi:hypothetical protein
MRSQQLAKLVANAAGFNRVDLSLKAFSIQGLKRLLGLRRLRDARIVRPETAEVQEFTACPTP